VRSPATQSSHSRRAAPLPPEQRRRAIIDAILPLLTEHGAGATTRRMAEAAGISEGTIFNVFADKDDLLAAALETAIDPAPLEAAISAIDPGVPFEQRLVEATELIQRRIVGIWRLISQLGDHHRPSERRPLPDSPALAALLATEPGRLRVDPADGARLLRALTLSCSHPMLAVEPRSPADIVDLFLRGAGARP
jgi:AcrR family transcriptional regulator